jgi:hypothetical protein
VNVAGWLEKAGLIKRPAAPVRETRGTVTTLARPTYATTLTGNALLPREVSFTLLRQFHRSVPVMGRAIEILSGFVGYPCIKSENEALQAETDLWIRNVAFGNVGSGLGPWVKDHLGQALLYGYAVGEMVPTPRRDEVEKLWSYLSPSFGFRTNAAGEFEIVQHMGLSQEVILDPATSLLTVPVSEGCSPNGQSLFFACPTYAQGWLDVAHAYRAMWKRNGIPTFHINWMPPPSFDDPNGTVSRTIRQEMADEWNEAMKSQVVDGVAKDFSTVGEATVKVIGADGAIIDITISKRAFVEEIVAATGIPAWMLGYSWSTTERLSTQQADMLLATVDNLRRAVTPAIEKILRTRMILAARSEEWELDWPDVNLQDRLQTAQADFQDARADQVREQVAFKLWQVGVWDQGMYAEAVTGSPEVVVPMNEPPVMAPAATDTGSGDGAEEEATGSNALLKELEWERSLPPLREMLPEYEARFPALCNGKH